MRVIFSPLVRVYFHDLIEILFEKEYFGFEESALKYVKGLFYEIKDTLPLHPKKIAPPYFDRYGKDMYYATFRKSKATQWYVFFSEYKNNGETVYLVKYISNNHVIAHLL